MNGGAIPACAPAERRGRRRGSGHGASQRLRGGRGPADQWAGGTDWDGSCGSGGWSREVDNGPGDQAPDDLDRLLCHHLVSPSLTTLDEVPCSVVDAPWRTRERGVARQVWFGKEGRAATGGRSLIRHPRCDRRVGSIVPCLGPLVASSALGSADAGGANVFLVTEWRADSMEDVGKEGARCSSSHALNGSYGGCADFQDTQDCLDGTWVGGSGIGDWLELLPGGVTLAVLILAFWSLPPRMAYSGSAYRADAFRRARCGGGATGRSDGCGTEPMRPPTGERRRGSQLGQTLRPLVSWRREAAPWRGRPCDLGEDVTRGPAREG